MKKPLSVAELEQRHCRAHEGGQALPEAAILAQLAPLPGWAHREGALERSYDFANYYATIAFVNAIAWMIHREDHHPDLAVHYNRCVVRFNTHSVGGISENDFICAAKCDAIFAAGVAKSV
jgi:4a-hydroxytetrahydrobiopterin dehydratase